MKITLNNKVYDLTFNAQVGVYYRYEVLFGSSFSNDFALYEGQIALMRLLYAILQNSNKGLELTFDDLLAAIDDEQFIDVCKWINSRFDYFAQEAENKEAAKEEEDGKNV